MEEKMKSAIVKLSKRQKRVFDLLCTGKHSATDITIKLGYSDPRSHIKRMIDKGVIIYSEWIEKGEVRFKRWWAESDKRSCEALPIGEILESPDFNKINYGVR